MYVYTPIYSNSGANVIIPPFVVVPSSSHSSLQLSVSVPSHAQVD